MKFIISAIVLGLFRTLYSTSTTATFNKLLDGCMDENHILQEAISPSLTTCLLRCMINPRCLSAAYNFEYRKCAIMDICCIGCPNAYCNKWKVFTLSLVDCPRGHYIGGSGGHEFTDFSIWDNNNITGIRLRSADMVYLFQVKYGNTWGNSHGCDSCGNLTEIVFDSGEYITQIDGSSGLYVNSLKIYTSQNTYGTYGEIKSKNMIFKGSRLLYVSGRKGQWLDRLSFHWET